MIQAACVGQFENDANIKVKVSKLFLISTSATCVKINNKIYSVMVLEFKMPPFYHIPKYPFRRLENIFWTVTFLQVFQAVSVLLVLMSPHMCTYILLYGLIQCTV